MTTGDKYQQTRQLLDIVENQSNSPIKAGDIKIAKQQLNEPTPNTAGAKEIIDTLRAQEMHPALSDAVNKAAYEVATPAAANRRGPRP